MLLSISCPKDKISIRIGKIEADLLKIIYRSDFDTKHQLINLALIFSDIDSKIQSQISDIVFDIGPNNFTILRSIICFLKGYVFNKSIKLHPVSNLISQVYFLDLNNFYGKKNALILKKISSNYLYSLFIKNDLSDVLFKSLDIQKIDEELKKNSLNDCIILSDFENIDTNLILEYDSEVILQSHVRYINNKKIKSSLYKYSKIIKPLIPSIFYRFWLLY